jgi:hypothetical protein
MPKINPKSKTKAFLEPLDQKKCNDRWYKTLFHVFPKIVKISITLSMQYWGTSAVFCPPPHLHHPTSPLSYPSPPHFS